MGYDEWSNVLRNTPQTTAVVIQQQQKSLQRASRRRYVLFRPRAVDTKPHSRKIYAHINTGTRYTSCYDKRSDGACPRCALSLCYYNVPTHGTIILCVNTAIVLRRRRSNRQTNENIDNGRTRRRYEINTPRRSVATRMGHKRSSPTPQKKSYCDTRRRRGVCRTIRESELALLSERRARTAGTWRDSEMFYERRLSALLWVPVHCSAPSSDRQLGRCVDFEFRPQRAEPSAPVSLGSHAFR